MAGKRVRTVPRLLLTREEAAEALGMSLSHFKRHVQPDLECVYTGQIRGYPVRELERWISENATRWTRPEREEEDGARAA